MVQGEHPGEDGQYGACSSVAKSAVNHRSWLMLVCLRLKIERQQDPDQCEKALCRFSSVRYAQVWPACEVVQCHIVLSGLSCGSCTLPCCILDYHVDFVAVEARSYLSFLHGCYGDALVSLHVIEDAWCSLRAGREVGDLGAYDLGIAVHVHDDLSLLGNDKLAPELASVFGSVG